MIKEGDLVVGNGRMATVTGSQKLVQDLRCWVLQRMGSDPYQLGYGSLIEGGVQPNGVVVESPIGMVITNWGEVESFISSDIQRIVSLYQNEQSRRIREDQSIYNKITLTPDEILKSLDNITYEVQEDTLNVVIHISNMAGQSFEVGLLTEGTGLQ